MKLFMKNMVEVNSLKINKDVVYREILGEHILIPVGAALTDKTGLFNMSELGAFIWKLINESKNEVEILSAILEEYDVEKEVAKTDLEEFLQKLKEFGIIE